MHLCRDIYDGNIELAKAEKDQGQFKLDLNEITRGNPKKKPADQIKTIENIKNLDKLRQIMILQRLDLKLNMKRSMEQEY